MSPRAHPPEPDLEELASILAQTNTARAHISYFLPFYGVLFGVLFALAPGKQTAFVQLCDNAGISLLLLVAPLVLASSGIIFVPIQVARDDSDDPSEALKALLAFTSLCQKTSIFLFMHTVLRVLAELMGLSMST